METFGDQRIHICSETGRATFYEADGRYIASIPLYVAERLNAQLNAGRPSAPLQANQETLCAVVKKATPHTKRGRPITLIWAFFQHLNEALADQGVVIKHAVDSPLLREAFPDANLYYSKIEPQNLRDKISAFAPLAHIHTLVREYTAIDACNETLNNTLPLPDTLIAHLTEDGETFVVVIARLDSIVDEKLDRLAATAPQQCQKLKCGHSSSLPLTYWGDIDYTDLLAGKTLRGRIGIAVYLLGGHGAPKTEGLKTAFKSKSFRTSKDEDLSLRSVGFWLGQAGLAYFQRPAQPPEPTYSRYKGPHVFSDGSHHQNNFDPDARARCVLGVYSQDTSPETNLAYAPPPWAHGGHAEIVALARAIDTAGKEGWHHVHIFTDSHSSIHLLYQLLYAPQRMRKRTLTSTAKLMIVAAERYGRPIALHWSPSHTGIKGNEKADKLASKGALDGSSPMIDLTRLGIPPPLNRRSGAWRDSQRRRR
ncbi:unnamed protein product [Vitrella brassicaformis CCMP3155]|uniref:RNase H type-1 domain-containing protein n=1 Tax=Vitrella brassicaformis (strain CCMP3155) TaxID=1169540 RepID=A0A0G4EAM2_VITBC|nr:unnamed protein product [Vitrella brassicaformis CCMP3155]|eukprot:CEL92304.1 unnamed protein product [Vitrella brassicaformis CCMP3155]